MNLADTLSQLTPTPGLLLLVIALTALVETLALIGLMIPGVVLITAAASLAGHQAVSPALVIGAAFIGAVIGDGLSYWLGHAQRERVTRMWPISHHPEWLARSARFFQRYGALSVFLGRFVGPVRPVIPLIAGMLRMPPRTFAAANIGSAVLWAPAYVLPGYLLGHSWQKLLDLPEGARSWLVLLGLLVVVLAVVFSWLRQQVSRRGRLYRWTATGARRHPVMRRLWLSQSDAAGGEVPLASWLLLVLALGALSGWTLMVIHQQGPLPFDLRAQAFFAALATPGLERLGQVFARLGDALGITALLLPWGIWLLLRHHLSAFFHIAAGMAGIATLNTLGKTLIGRPRPFAPDHLADSLSYPSAHASTVVVVAGLAAAFLAAELPHRHRYLAYWGAILAALPMALSRLVIGVHWLSDVVGGALLGLVVCALVRLAWQQRPHPPLAPCPVLRLAAASLVLVTARILWLPPV